MHSNFRCVIYLNYTTYDNYRPLNGVPYFRANSDMSLFSNNDTSRVSLKNCHYFFLNSDSIYISPYVYLFIVFRFSISGVFWNPHLKSI